MVTLVMNPSLSTSYREKAPRMERSKINRQFQPTVQFLVEISTGSYRQSSDELFEGDVTVL